MEKYTDQETLLKDNVEQLLGKEGLLNEEIKTELDEVNNKLLYLIGNVQAGVLNDTTPAIEEIKVGEHIINHSLTSDAQNIFASLYGQQEVTTKQELEERKKLFEENIYPVITQCTKKIYSLIK